MHAALQVLKDMNYIEGLGVAALADPSLRRHVEPRVFLREVTRLRQGTPVVKAMTRRERVAHERAALLPLLLKARHTFLLHFSDGLLQAGHALNSCIELIR